MRIKQALIGLVAASGALGLGELFVRLAPPPALQALETRERRERHPLHPESGIYTLDPELGYRPLPGGRTYDLHGVKRHDYPSERLPSTRRLLFIGDSVTHRARIIEGLKLQYGEQGYEYWNAGVEGYNAAQVEGYYRLHLSEVSEDHAILTFHLNDYTVTPITFLAGDRLVLVRSGMPDVHVVTGLYHHSHLYRLYLALKARQVSTAERLELQTEGVRAALAGVRDTARGRGSRLTVLVLPWFAPPSEWEDKIRQRYDNVMALLNELELDHYSLIEVLEEALEDGLDVLDLVDDPKHRVHPSREFGIRSAAYLEEKGFSP